MQAMQQSSLLRHCILALSYRHVDHDTGACTSEATAYKRRATQMLQDKIRTEAAGESQSDASLLDASIVLMTLDVSSLPLFVTLLLLRLLTMTNSAPRPPLARGHPTCAVPSGSSRVRGPTPVPAVPSRPPLPRPPMHLQPRRRLPHPQIRHRGRAPSE